ncbi:lipopolysaccharide export system permease protein [Sphingobacterium allocomposti]|jgi:lipopolysaccharide export system permease protein|uniref:Lipopolysaccharide export system permease protein n=1 Tax=Sphingobacterium allocomposti TaxID=415956 RepID=A0A5S5DK05_9SPHI|nr:LptF/LptG family permease [Sphingobacterium composti Yoo et al. 2007 non Ten et al. 2007]TYP96241.1 lipopolysaccharide export system permease protein [Sphingobacterium composti Yoo et al. 2007 non Ten et al. 2007]HLS94658.1 LptF/LptG family permease [Sphingobacterium sp.]
MKKIHLLILQAFIRPFMVCFCIVMFVLLMLFLFKYIDDLIGKGFEWYVLMELIGYQCAVQLSMALPLSMLLSSIMTFGNLGESYELVAIKAAGYSLRKAMTPLIFLVALFAGGSFLFSDYILPVVNLKMGSLLWDVRNKKADFLIKPGIFNNSIPGYSIRARSKSEDGTILYDLMIYDHRSGNSASNVLLAKEGFMQNSADNNYMILRLKDGVRYEESRAKNAKRYDPRQQFTRFRFKETEQKFDMEAFQMKRTDESLFKTHHSMLNLKQLKLYTDSNRLQMDSVSRIVFMETKNYVSYLSSYYRDPKVKPAPIKGFNDFLQDYVPADQRRSIISNALGQAQQLNNIFEMKDPEFRTYVDKDIRYHIEFHRKFTLAVSCLLLFAIGAPLGAIIRKGGLGLPVVVAIIFFLIYHIISTMAEKAAKDGSMDPLIGMWMAVIVLTPLAIFLTYKSTTDSALFDADQYKIKAEAALKWIKDKLGRKAK